MYKPMVEVFTVSTEKVHLTTLSQGEAEIHATAVYKETDVVPVITAVMLPAKDWTRIYPHVLTKADIG